MSFAVDWCVSLLNSQENLCNIHTAIIMSGALKSDGSLSPLGLKVCFDWSPIGVWFHVQNHRCCVAFPCTITV